LVVRGDLGQAVLKRVLKGGAVRIVLGGATLLFDNLPPALKEMEMGGTGRQ
jgi:hypothetical protein